MDFLKSTISSEIKKRKLEYDTVSSRKPANSKKYVTVKELEDVKAENQKSSQKSSLSSTTIPTSPSSKPSALIENDPLKTEEEELEAYNIPEAEIVRRLRARNEPIRMFAETNKQRKLRLRTLELMDEKTEGQRNDFMKAFDDIESGTLLEDLKKKANLDEDEKLKRIKRGLFFKQFDTSLLSLKLLEKDPDKTYTLVYAYFKRMLFEWEEFLQQRPEAERRSTQGKLASATQVQSSEYMKPFFRMLKKKTIDYNVLARITEIAMNMQLREYVKANDAYLRLAIGNSPWPIGVTMVG
ncbi:Pre-mRNA-splicing factor 18, partial [Smittium mucronatum]